MGGIRVVVSTERTMALHCPACEKMQYHVFSMFELTKSPRPLQCSCGFTQGHLAKKGRRYEVRLLCPSGERLRLLYSLKEFSSAPLLSFLTPEDGEPLGFLGDYRQVEEAVAQWEQENREEFTEPDVMHSILERLQALAREDKISCDCEHPSVGIDVFPDKVELICSFCGSAVLMGATTKKDVERLHRLSEIVMKRSSYTYLEEWLKPFS